ncbi:MAG: hypothetical protein WA885_17420 [Phormidesmis sp.]
MSLEAINTAPIPTEAEHFKARYKIWIGVVLLSLGLLCTVLTVWDMLRAGEFSAVVIVGVVVAIAGYLYLTRPYFVLAPNRLTIYSPIGQVVKRYPLVAFSDIAVENGQVYIESLGREKTKLSRFLTRSADWKTLERIAGL